MGSGAQGIVLTEHSQGTILNGIMIAENAGNGIDMQMSQANIAGSNTIRGDGVMGCIGTTLVLHGNEISGNGASGVTCMGNSL